MKTPLALHLLLVAAACGDAAPERRAPSRGLPAESGVAELTDSAAESYWTLCLDAGFGAAHVEEAEILLSHAGGNPGPRLALRGIRGTLPGHLAVGTYKLSVRSLLVGWAETRRPVKVDPERIEVSPALISIGPGVPSPLALSIRRRTGTCRINVHVQMNGTGVPVEGARIQVFQWSEQQGEADLVADLHAGSDGRAAAVQLLPGRYRVSLVEAGESAETTVTHADHRKSQQERIVLAEGQLRELTFVVGAAGGIEAEVTGFEPARDGHLTCALFRLWPDGVWRPVDTGGPVLRGTSLSMRGLAPASYRVVLWATGRQVRAHEIEVQEGSTSRIKLELGAVNPVRVTLEYAGTEPIKEGLRFNLNRLDDSDAQDIATGILRQDEPLLLEQPGSPRPGTYLLLLWDRRLAMIAEISGKASQAIRVALPNAGARPGPRALTVRAERDGEPLRRLCVGLRCEGAEGPWMRFEEVWYNEARFTCLAIGDYEVLLYDGAFGVRAGFGEQPIRKRVEIREKDEMVVISPFGH